MFIILVTELFKILKRRLNVIIRLPFVFYLNYGKDFGRVVICLMK